MLAEQVRTSLRRRPQLYAHTYFIIPSNLARKTVHARRRLQSMIQLSFLVKSAHVHRTGRGDVEGGCVSYPLPIAIGGLLNKPPLLPVSCVVIISWRGHIHHSSRRSSSPCRVSTVLPDPQIECMRQVCTSRTSSLRREKRGENTV